MESDLQQQQPHQFQNHHYQQQMNSGLMRYRSAPSSFFANFLDDEQYLHVRPSSPETERFIARFMAEDSSSLPEIQKNSPPTEHQHQHQQQTQFAAPMKHEPEGFQQQHQQPQNGYSSAAPLVYQSSSRPPLPNHSASATASEMDGHYRGVTSMAVDHQLPPAKMGGGGGGGGGGDGNNSNLIRQSSSPPGLFSHVNIENGYGIMRGMGNFGSINGTNGEASFSSASRLKGQINFSSGPPSSSGLMTHMPDIGNKSLGASSPDSGSFSDGRGNNGCYLTGFPIGSWEDSGILSENLNDLRRAKDDDRRTFSGLNVSETQHGRPANHNHTPAGLPRHLSLPKTSSEIAAIEKYLQFQDSVPCKIRAKRGCATHPRSIAERVRRTRISERMRKLQELVPNMDKQTSTADMLDLAVEYIKDLQKQVKTLNDTRAKCTCSNKRKQP